MASLVNSTKCFIVCAAILWNVFQKNEVEGMFPDSFCAKIRGGQYKKESLMNKEAKIVSNMLTG